jgi:acyl-CoA dehydrogenase-like protein
MSSVQQMVAEAADDFFRRECTTEVAAGEGAELRAKFERAGLLEGAELPEAAVVASVAAQYAAPVDVAEEWLNSRDDAEADRRRLGAALRAAQMAGALERVQELTVEHASTRTQFGQPLRRFQAVGQQLAVMAGEVAAARAAADAAIADPVEWKVAAAKVRAGEAVGRVADIAHQVHGAIGFTDEHPLHLFTRLLWRWRDEFGSEAEWASRLGSLVEDKELWPLLTGSD